jgi:hypothetical protein
VGGIQVQEGEGKGEDDSLYLQDSSYHHHHRLL